MRVTLLLPGKPNHSFSGCQAEGEKKYLLPRQFPLFNIYFTFCFRAKVELFPAASLCSEPLGVSSASLQNHRHPLPLGLFSPEVGRYPNQDSNQWFDEFGK